MASRVSKKTVLLAITGIAVVCLGLGALWIQRLSRLSEALELVMDGNPSDEQLVQFLGWNDETLLANSLSRLEHQKIESGREQAAKLMADSRPYVWFSACQYLGALGDDRSIPYLIRGLDHPAWRSRPQTVAYLKRLTGQDHGENKEAWIHWWSSTHPGKTFDFTCIKTR